MRLILLFFCCIPFFTNGSGNFRNDSLFLQSLKSGDPLQLCQWFYPEKMAEELFWNKYLHTQSEFAEHGEKKLNKKQFVADFKKNGTYLKEKNAFQERMHELRNTSFFQGKNSSWKTIGQIRADMLYKKPASHTAHFSADFLKNIYYESYEIESNEKCFRIDIGVIAGANGNKYVFDSNFSIMPVLNPKKLYEMFIAVLAESRGYNPFVVVDVRTSGETALHEFCIDTRTFLYFRSNYSHLPSDPEKIKSLFPDRILTVDSLQMLFLKKEFGSFHPEINSQLAFSFANCRSTTEIALQLNSGKLLYPGKQKEEMRKWAHRLFLSGIMCEENSFREKAGNDLFIPLYFLPE